LVDPLLMDILAVACDQSILHAKSYFCKSYVLIVDPMGIRNPD